MTGRDRWISGVAGFLAALAGAVVAVCYPAKLSGELLVMACAGALVAAWATRGTR